MSHRWVAFLLLGGLILTLGPAVRAEEEPEVAGKKLSFWLKELAAGKDARARRRGAIALELIGYEKSRTILPALVKAIREDGEPLVRAAAARSGGRAAAKALEQAREEKKDELPRFDNLRDALGTALRTDRSEIVREAAALALGDLGPDARASVGALGQALRDKHPGTVRAAAAALRRVGKDADDAQADLLQLLADPKADRRARADAAVCLGQIRADVSATLPTLEKVLTDTSADEVDKQGRRTTLVRKAVAEALGKLGKGAAGATPDLAAVLTAKESTPELQLAAVTALDHFGTGAKAAIPALIRAVGDTELIRRMGDNARYIRCLAMHALGRMGKELNDERKSAVAALLHAVEEPNVEVCVTAIETLGVLGAEGLGTEVEEVVRKLDLVLAREGRKSIREAAQTARDRIRRKK